MPQMYYPVILACRCVPPYRRPQGLLRLGRQHAQAHHAGKAERGAVAQLDALRPQVVQQRIEPFVSASFFSADLDGMRAGLQSMPWIARAEVREKFGD